MTDGYVGLVRTPKPENIAPIVTRCRISVEEIADKTGAFRSLASAKFSITNLDIDPLSSTGIVSVKIERNSFIDSEEDYLVNDTKYPSSWEVIGTYYINNSNELVGNNNSAVVIAPNIPANPAGYKHKFKITFLNKDGIPARLIPFYDGEAFEPYIDETAKDVFIAGTIVEGDIVTFTPTVSQGFEVGSLQHFGCQLYTYDNKPYFIKPAPILSNGANTLNILNTVPVHPYGELDNCTKIRFEESESLILFGSDATGYTFNGISDLDELVSVLDISSEVSTDSWSSPVSATPVSLPKNKLKIKWKNMYRHASVDVVNGSGTVVNVKDKWNNISGYGIYMYIADDSSLPSSGNYPGDSGSENNGVWHKIDEVQDKHLPISSQSTYEYIITDLPPSKNIGIWVGAFTPYTSTEVRGLNMRSAL